jgi:hypothetical protein
MAITTEKAYEVLNLPLGSSKDAIEQSYKKLAVKWHPEKYASSKNSAEAIKVIPNFLFIYIFQGILAYCVYLKLNLIKSISVAIKKLIGLL